MNGLDLLLMVLVVAGVFWLALDRARCLDERDLELERRHRDRVNKARRELDSSPREQLTPFDWEQAS